jgi:hypothetical protein
MKNVVNQTVLRSVNAQNQKRLAKKSPKHQVKNLKPPVTARVMSQALVMNQIVIVRSPVALTNVPKYLIWMISQLQHVMTMFPHPRLHFRNASIQTGAHGLHAAKPVLIMTIQELDQDHETVTKHPIANARTTYTRLKSAQSTILLRLANANLVTGANGVPVPNHATAVHKHVLDHAHVVTAKEIHLRHANAIHIVVLICLNPKTERNSVVLVSIIEPRSQRHVVLIDQTIVLF